MNRISSMTKDAWEIFNACRSMLFRPSIRRRLLFLIGGFILMMGYNIYSHFDRIETIKAEKKAILEEDAFKIFFVFSLESEDFEELMLEAEKNLEKYGAVLIDSALIFQKNLYLDILPPDKAPIPLKTLYNVFNINDFANEFYSDEDHKYCIINKAYLDYNGAQLDEKKHKKRFAKTKGDIDFLMEDLLEEIGGHQEDAFREQQKIILDMKKVQYDKDINQYASKIELIFPRNFLSILVNLSQLSTNKIEHAIETDASDSAIKIRKKYAQILKTHISKEETAYRSWMPSYVPVYSEYVIKEKQGSYHYFLMPYLEISTPFMDYLKILHFSGHYLFSFEKLHIIEYKVNKINRDIWSGQCSFIVIDAIIGIVFPFMISFFSFIYLKKEIAFLLFYKNKLRLVLWIFYLSPLCLMIVLKLGLYLCFFQSDFVPHVVLPLLVIFLVVSIVFWHMNKWCFDEFQDDDLKLYSIFKGK